MRFGEFSLTLRVRLNSLQSIQRKLVTHKVGSASSDDQIESVLSWVAPNNKNEELNIR